MMSFLRLSPKPFNVRRRQWNLLRWICISTVLSAFGCTANHERATVNSTAVSDDGIPAVVAAAQDKVAIMTLPVQQTSNCFPQSPRWVRRVNGVVMIQDLS